MKDELQDGIPAEVDFSNGIRGKYAGRIQHDAVYMPLEADVAKTFRTPEEVNSALRMLIKTAAAAVPSSNTEAT